jgi:hypothetical protein
MAVVFEAGYTLPGADEPLTHARIAHSGNWLSGGTVTASTTATDFFADGPDNSLTYEKWQPTASPATWEYDHGSAVETDYCVIGAHNLGTVSATVEVQAEISTIWTTLVSVSPTTDEPIMAIFEPRTQQKWRLNITYAGTAPTIGVIKFGKALQMQRPLYGQYTPPNLARATTLRSTYSESGEFLGRTKLRTYLEFPMQWSLLTRSWVDTNWLPAIKSMESEPFFIAPIPSVHPDVTLCQTVGEIQAPQQSANGYLTAALQLRGLGYD